MIFSFRYHGTIPRGLIIHANHEEVRSWSIYSESPTSIVDKPFAPTLPTKARPHQQRLSIKIIFKMKLSNPLPSLSLSFFYNIILRPWYSARSSAMISSLFVSLALPLALHVNAAVIPRSNDLDISQTLQNILANTHGSDAYSYPTDLTRGIIPVRCGGNNKDAQADWY